VGLPKNADADFDSDPDGDSPMRIAYIAAGAGSMYCGSCLRDNALAAALIAQGRDVILAPAYTPMKTDEDCAAIDHVVCGAMNVYLQHATSIFRHTPRFIDRLLDNRSLLRFVSRFSSSTRAESLGALTMTILQGDQGRAGKEARKLAAWLAEDIKPQIVNLPNTMFAGMAREIKKQTGAPVICSLAGEDSFIEALPESHKTQCHDELRRQAKHCNGFVAPSIYYADFMAQYLDVPRERIHVVPLGINMDGHGVRNRDSRPTDTVAFLARVCPDKGLHILGKAFALLKRRPEGKAARLQVAGYLDPKERGYLDAVRREIEDAGFGDFFEYAGELSREEKIEFLNRSSVLCVPSAYPEPKGLFVLEALANGVPVVAPRTGAFPELIESTGGGVLVPPGDPAALADALAGLLGNPEHARETGRRGEEAVRRNHRSHEMANGYYAVYEKHVP
jgi:glycosyltransferase involved in cell wall biosynthesis